MICTARSGMSSGQSGFTEVVISLRELGKMMFDIVWTDSAPRKASIYLLIDALPIMFVSPLK